MIRYKRSCCVFVLFNGNLLLYLVSSHAYAAYYVVKLQQKQRVTKMTDMTDAAHINAG